MPKFDHPGMAEIPAEQREGIVRDMFGKMMLAMGENAFAVSDEWNQRFPDYEFDAAEEFIAKVWTGNGAIA